MEARGRVYLVDDNADVLHHTGGLLRQMGYVTEVFAAGRDFLASAERLCWPAVVLLDMRMPVLDGLSLQQRLREMEIACAIVFISGESQPPEIVEAMKCGAIDFLFKPAGFEEIQQAIATALGRAERLAIAYVEAGRVRRALAELSVRELDVLVLMLAGQQNREIATKLNIQAGTVKKHRAAICEKFGVEGTSGVVALVDQVNEIVDPPGSFLANPNHRAGGKRISIQAPLSLPSDQFPRAN